LPVLRCPKRKKVCCSQRKKKVRIASHQPRKKEKKQNGRKGNLGLQKGDRSRARRERGDADIDSSGDGKLTPYGPKGESYAFLGGGPHTSPGGGKLSSTRIERGGSVLLGGGNAPGCKELQIGPRGTEKCAWDEGGVYDSFLERGSWGAP